MSEERALVPDPPPSPIDVIEETKRLTDRLTAVERYLASLPWKVDAQVKDGQDFILSLERKARGWALVCKQAHYEVEVIRGLQFGDAEERWEETLLRDASVEVKSRVAMLLPRFLKAMREEYDRRVALLAEGNRALDAFTSALGLADVKGGA